MGPSERALIGRHLLLGWAGLLLFSALGMGLELLHGFKLPWYIEHAHETRRLMWTLAHAHGALLSLIQLAYVGTLRLFGDEISAQAKLAGKLLIASLVLMPGGFFLGGARIYGGDPGLGVLFVPLGALCLLIALGLMALTARRWSSAPTADAEKT